MRAGRRFALSVTSSSIRSSDAHRRVRPSSTPPPGPTLRRSRRGSTRRSGPSCKAGVRSLRGQTPATLSGSSEGVGVFQIGNSLRTAREQQQLELAAGERETRIRTKYLQALEEERFDVLPGTAYVKGFLRTYADFLGLDGPRFVDEFNERFAPTELPEAPPPVRIRGPRRWLDARLVAIPLFVGVALLGWG